MKSKAEEKARELLARCGSTIPVDVYEVARQLDVQIVEDTLPAEVSGILYSPKPGATLIVLNQAQSEKRKRFSIAHEIGHFVLNHHTEVHVDKKMLFRDELSSAAISPIEIDANTFAAELLMPAALVKEAYIAEMSSVFKDEDDLLIKLASKFDVSQIAMGYRLKNLELSMP